ncbi:type III effector [Echinicola pacifica]|uniref:Type III effector n=1 Tax=Echinicola pacifica TaxID=346377 RepID=A0A918UJ68_9BACT|nr:HopJ type III effector protein [Echinicola pacifica]GGZ14106.1 type III effector [Echinicola pacifica]
MTFLEKVKSSPEQISFQETISYIDANYHFEPCQFTNGNTVNEAGKNNGSCKIFSLGQQLELSKEQTLQLFGDIYRNDVLGNPEGTDHQNIRNFMDSGWQGIAFEGQALRAK